MLYGIPTRLAGDIPWLRRAPADGSYFVFEPETIALPMRHGPGKPCVPVVSEGETVSRYQAVAECEGGVTVHSGISGRVVGLEKTPHVFGGWQDALVIENDMLHKEKRFPPPARKAMRGPGLFHALRKAGIPDAHGGYAGDPMGKIEVCLINGCECEPAIDADAVLMRNFAREIVRGSLLIMRAAGARKVIIGVEAERQGALADMRAACQGRSGRVSVRALPRIYPAGSMQRLVYHLTGREYGHDGRPEDVGVMVMDVVSALAVYRLATEGLPFTHRLISVCGDVATPRTVLVPVGTRVRELLGFCGGLTGRPAQILMGGPLTGKSVRRLDTPILKDASGLFVINEDHADRSVEYTCIRCNRCSEACPVRLMPQLIEAGRRKGSWRECARLGAESCIRCGCCSYVCPSSIPLAANIANLADALGCAGEEGK